MRYWDTPRIVVARDHSNFTARKARWGLRTGIMLDADDEFGGELYGDGYLEGLFHLPEGPEPKDLKSDPSHFGGNFAIAAGELDEDGLALYRNADLDLDRRYAPIPASGETPWPLCGAPAGTSTPPAPVRNPDTDSAGMRPTGRPWPERHPGIVIAATEEWEQHLTGHMTWAGVLVADHRGDEEPQGHYSTAIVDIDGRALGDERVAPLHGLVRVEKSWRDHCSPALFFATRDGELDVGGGQFYIRGRRGAGRPRLGYLSTEFLGPMTAGGTDDKHIFAVTRDGLTVAQGHLDLGAPWYLDDVRDAPPEIDLFPYVEPVRSGIWVETVIRYDAIPFHEAYAGARRGLFRLESRSLLYTEDPQDPPPFPPKDPPPLLPPSPPPIGSQPRGGDGFAIPGVVRLPDGSIAQPDGTIIRPDGSEVIPFPEGSGSRVRPIPLPDPRTDLEELAGGALELDGLATRPSYAMTWLDLVTPALVGQAWPIGCPIRDDHAPAQEEISEAYRKLPQTWREETYGSYDGDGELLYTLDPTDEGPRISGSSSGGAHFMPPELSLLLIDEGREDELSGISTTYRSFHDGARLGFGTPILRDGGGLKDGFAVYKESGKLNISVLDGDGAATKRFVMSATGAISSVVSLSVADSVAADDVIVRASAQFFDSTRRILLDTEGQTASNVTQLLPWKTGTLALRPDPVAVDSASSTSITATPDSLIIVDTATDPVEVTLPEIGLGGAGKAGGGARVTIKDAGSAGTNAITVVCAGSDIILDEGDADIEITADYGSLTLLAVVDLIGGNYWVVAS